MENHAIQPKRSIFGAFMRGLVFTAITGALMAGIFSLVGAAAFAVTAPAVAAAAASGTPSILGAFGVLGSEFSLMSTLGSMLLIGLSTGAFGGLIQAHTAYTQNNAPIRTGHSHMRGRDIAVTAVSNNLMQPAMHRALNGAPLQEKTADLEHPKDEGTRYREQIGHRPSLSQRLNGIMARDSATGDFRDRITAERAEPATGKALS